MRQGKSSRLYQVPTARSGTLGSWSTRGTAAIRRGSLGATFERALLRAISRVPINGVTDIQQSFSMKFPSSNGECIARGSNTQHHITCWQCYKSPQPKSFVPSTGRVSESSTVLNTTRSSGPVSAESEHLWNLDGQEENPEYAPDSRIGEATRPLAAECNPSPNSKLPDTNAYWGTL